jgi:hypothetical protein
VKDLNSGLEVQALAGPMVDPADLGAQLLVGDLGQIDALGQVLPQQAVGVFVGAPLPAVVGMGRIDGQVRLLYQLDGTSELAAIVQGEAAALSRRAIGGSSVAARG